MTWNSTVDNTDAGGTARVGTRVLWMFGDSFGAFPDEPVPGQPRSCVFAWGRRTSPLPVREYLISSDGAPEQCLPYTSSEIAFNQGSSHRKALWPGGMIDNGNRQALVFYNKYDVPPFGYNYVWEGTGLARVSEGETSAQRESGLIFDPAAGDIKMDAQFSVKESDGNVYIYLYGTRSSSNETQELIVGRVQRNQVSNRSQYSFWNGSTWGPLAGATSVIPATKQSQPGVAWNAYLGKYMYMGTYVDLITPAATTKIRMATAPRPEGPWSTETLFDLAGVGAKIGMYYVIMHPAIEDGQFLPISWANPTTGNKHNITMALLKLR